MDYPFPRFKLGHCFEFNFNDQQYKGRVIQNSMSIYTVRLCGSNETIEVPYNNMLTRDVITITEIECLECDGDVDLTTKANQ